MSIFNISKHINSVADDTRAYLDSTLNYYKLDMFKKSMSGAVSLVNLLVAGSILMIFILFISVGFAIIIGESLGSLSYGYFVMAGIYLLSFILYRLFGKPIITKIVLTKYSKIFFQDDDEDDKKKESRVNDVEVYEPEVTPIKQYDESL